MEDDSGKLTIDGTEYSTEVPDGTYRGFTGLPDSSIITAFIPGTVVSVEVSPGQRVAAGDVLLLLDAMKMHNEICSEISGRVERVHVSAGDTVLKDQLLVEIEQD